MALNAVDHSSQDVEDTQSEDLGEKILLALDNREPLNTMDIASEFHVPHQLVVGAMKSLEAHGNLIKTEQVVNKHMELTEEGKEVAANGSHEAIIWKNVDSNGTALSKLMKLPNAKIGFNKAMSAGWIRLDKKTGSEPIVFRKVDKIDDAVQHTLNLFSKMQIDNISDQTKADLKKRKLIYEVSRTTFLLSRGEEFSTTLEKAETDLTAELLIDDAWKKKRFKPYNFKAKGLPPTRGYLHPLLQVRAEFRQIFLEMGFSEMPTSNYVESSFWNFDALFQPQNHPARDAQDTFFVSDPPLETDFPEEYLQRVKMVHSVGGYGSEGYQYEWKLEEAQKNVLRTHTTACSAKMLYKLAKEKPFKPAKYFSIDRVFRNETLDATHLAEFHQIEGIVAAEDLSLSHLIGILYEFFQKLGLTELRFKPAYNPYTEPSMEIFCYHPSLKKWVEVGNSGMFRPEVLLPMGLPENVNVIAWGLSLERPTMIKYGISNIRDLFGPRVDLGMIASSPICQF
ncbi:phenylalanyl tRNA synthetase alpha chain [Trichuris trichiura]|uniref:Phenylalanine--tRNA ligase alpha subunit n=1 Tax=Trichuris trichiura TaxID=36087 RepID=A0A077Z553_TRITR|nr:phenylalanyl tRNA synthetase alpha chain [Trichuris trichiura]